MLGGVLGIAARMLGIESWRWAPAPAKIEIKISASKAERVVASTDDVGSGGGREAEEEGGREGRREGGEGMGV